jgi:Na+/melibiose symporter-like transporter
VRVIACACGYMLLHVHVHVLFCIGLFTFVCVCCASVMHRYKAAAKFGKVRTMQGSICGFIPSCLLLGFLPRATQTFGVHIVLALWSGAMLGPMYLVPWMMLTDTIDEHELETGR